MKLWLDDVRSPPDDTWTWVKKASLCCKELERLRGQVTFLSLDHDLASVATGYDVVVWLEQRAFQGELDIIPASISIHSANPVGRNRMNAGLASLRKTMTGKRKEANLATRSNACKKA